MVRACVLRALCSVITLAGPPLDGRHRVRNLVPVLLRRRGDLIVTLALAAISYAAGRSTIEIGDSCRDRHLRRNSALQQVHIVSGAERDRTIFGQCRLDPIVVCSSSYLSWD
jgi:hypothetical protein